MIALIFFQFPTKIDWLMKKRLAENPVTARTIPLEAT
jgi:hypothetical protein